MPGGNKKSSAQSKALYNKAYEAQHPLKDMFKETAEPEKVLDFIAEAEFIAGDPKALIDLSMGEDSCIKQKERECMIDQNIKIIDFQLDARGPMEDQYYGLDPFLVKNVRRGNTILEVKT